MNTATNLKLTKRTTATGVKENLPAFSSAGPPYAVSATTMTTGNIAAMKKLVRNGKSTINTTDTMTVTNLTPIGRSSGAECSCLLGKTAESTTAASRLPAVVFQALS